MCSFASKKKKKKTVSFLIVFFLFHSSSGEENSGSSGEENLNKMIPFSAPSTSSTGVPDDDDVESQPSVAGSDDEDARSDVAQSDHEEHDTEGKCHRQSLFIIRLACGAFQSTLAVLCEIPQSSGASSNKNKIKELDVNPWDSQLQISPLGGHGECFWYPCDLLTVTDSSVFLWLLSFQMR